MIFEDLSDIIIIEDSPMCLSGGCACASRGGHLVSSKSEPRLSLASINSYKQIYSYKYARYFVEIFCDKNTEIHCDS